MIGFRVDANKEIATGHLMRCLSIADAIRRMNGECIFFVADRECAVIIEEKHYEYVILNSDWKNLDFEVNSLMDKIIEYNLNWLVVDSYSITEQYIRRLNDVVPVLGVDVSEEKFFEISAILNYSHIDGAYELKKKYSKYDTMIMTGLEYAPLRMEFEPENRVFGREKIILITAGGTDPYNISFKIAKKLLNLDDANEYRICVVLGRLYDNISMFEQLKDDRLTVFQDVRNMSELMQKSEIVISAGGSTSIELCACHTPTVCFSFADNQIPFSKALSEVGALIYVGDFREGEISLLEGIVSNTARLIKDGGLKMNLSKKMSKLCDGRGAIRIAEYLLNNRM